MSAINIFFSDRSHVRQYIVFLRLENTNIFLSAFFTITMANECNYGDSVVHHVPQELTNENKKYAELYLNETNETRENAVTEIRRWLEDELRIKIGKSGSTD